MPKAIVLMSAVLPTQGHRDLVNFAYLLTNDVNVLLSSRTKEPIKGSDRVNAFYRQVYADWGEGAKIFFTHHEDDDAPQYPSGEDDEEFWDYWRSVILEHMAVASDDVVVASELYGLKLAETLGCKFVPYDIDREIRPITGTEVREYIYDYWPQIMPESRRSLKSSVTIFGAESCGKTTMAREISMRMNGVCLPEWARQYLETVGPELTDEKMATIAWGQASIEYAERMSVENFLVVKDTDLLSTIGYYRLTGREVPRSLETNFMLNKSELYILMNDNIPFVPDPLRYGGDRRESDMNFWEQLLREYKCRYVIVQSTDKYEQVEEVMEYVDDLMYEKSGPIADFRRELPEDEEDVDIEAKFA